MGANISKDRKLNDDELKNLWLLQSVNGGKPETRRTNNSKEEIDTKWCFKHGADVNTKDSSNNTSLHVAVRSGDATLADLLLKYGADVNTVDNDHNTPLHVAVRSGDATLTNVVLKYGADVNTVNNEGNTPFHITVRSGDAVLTDLLLKYGADMNTVNNEGNTALHAAVSCGDAAVTNLLLKYGADVNTINSEGNTPLLVAVSSRDAVLTDLLLKYDADVNTVNNEGNTALHAAVSCGDATVTNLLLKYGADVNTINNEGNTPLLVAVSSRNAALIDLLLKYDADVNMVNNEGNTPLHVAVSCGDAALTNLLLKYDADVNTVINEGNTPLHTAVRSGDATLVDLLLKFGAIVNKKNDIGDTPLHPAVWFNKTSIVELLLKHGADVNTKDKIGCTPLHYAVRRKKALIVDTLLKFGANVNIVDERGYMLLHVAIRFKDAFLVNQLLKFGADVNATFGEHYTPLHQAVEFDELPIVDLLLNYGADVNVSDNLGDTPLHQTAFQGNESIMNRLLIHGADVNMINKSFVTPLHLAVQRNISVVNLLLNFKANVNMTNSDGWTPLRFAVIKGDVNIVDRLLQSNVDLDIADSRGMTPLHVAAYHKKISIVNLLLKFKADAKITDICGFTPLHRAAETGEELIIKALLNCGVEVNAKNKKGNTPLHLVAYRNPPVVDLLLRSNADVNAMNNAGDTTLHRTARYGKAQTVKLLLEYDADVNAMNGSGNMALHEAVIYGNKDVVSLLLNDIDVNTTNIISNQPLSLEMLLEQKPRLNLPLDSANTKSPNDIGNTSLHLAAFYGKGSILNLLLQFKANVNAKNGAGNTPLHLAARCKHANIVEMLLKNGADVTLRNFDSDTPLTVARVFNYEGNEEIVRILEIAEKLAPSKDESQTPNDIVAVPNNNLTKKEQPEFKYSKRVGTSGVSGQLYQTKLLCLVLIRALNDDQIEHFFLGTNISGIGDMDDVCMRYRVRSQNRPVLLFVQVKHREKGSFTDASGDFSLRKYFDSYLTIKDRFRSGNEDPMFEGNFADVECNLVIYTPAKDGFTKKNTERQLNEKVHYLINTRQNADVFQYNYDENDIDYLIENTVIEELKKFGTAFLELIISKKNHPDAILENKLIARYHVVMRQKVLHCKVQHTSKEYRIWEFKTDFFESKCPYLVALKKSFIEELSANRIDQSEITNEDLENIKQVLQNPCAASIRNIIGKLATYDYKTKKLNLTDAFRKIERDDFDKLLEGFNKMYTNENIVYEAARMKLTELEIKLPLAFGNIDMMFRGSKTEVQRRMKIVADKLIYLFDINKDSKIIDFNEDNVGPGKTVEHDILDINDGIGSAVGNLLVLDTNSEMLKLDLENESLAGNAALFVKELKDDRYKPVNEEISSYRIRININGFPKHTFDGDEYYKNLGRDFLGKLWFFTNQEKENEVELTIKSHINKYYNNGNKANDFMFNIHCNAIFLKSHDEVQKWWMKQSETYYLTRASDFFGRAKLACFNDILLTVINYMYYLDISNISLKFNQRIYQNNSCIGSSVFNETLSKLFDIFDTQNKSVNISIKEKKKIVDLLQAVDKIGSNIAFKNNDPSHTAYNTYHSKVKVATPHNNIQNFGQTKFEFLKKVGTSGLCGQLYETKLLCLVLMRALNDDQIEHFFLGTNIRDIGDMDDICLRYRVRGQDRPVVLFVQAKHREDNEKGKLTVEEVQNASGDFSLRKYFESYITIKDRFQAENKDLMFEGDFSDVECNLIIYTPAKECFTKKKTELQVSEKVHYLINTRQNADVFQYNYEEADIDCLTEKTVIERIKKFGIVFLELIMSDKVKPNVILVNKLIARYHVAVGRKVLQQCKMQGDKAYRMWEFRPDFFESKCSYLVTLKNTFIKELLTKHINQSKITNEDLENFKQVLQNPCAFTISNIIGKLAIYNHNTKKLQLADISALKKKIKQDEFSKLLEGFSKIAIDENDINEAAKLKLATLEVKLPLEFANLDMMFRGSEVKVQKRMKAVADKLIYLLNINKDFKIIDINDDIVGQGKIIEQGIIDINGGIGSAVGNLLVLDEESKMLKFNLDIESLPENAALFANELKNDKYKPINEELSNYRIKINIDGFPKYSFNGDEYDKKQAKDYLNKLWFYTNQAKENEVELILKDEILKYYNEKIGISNSIRKDYTESVYLNSHDDIQKWWMQTDESHYLSRASDLFERAELEDIANLLLTVINYMYITEINSIDINIRQHTTEHYKFVQMHQSFNKISGRLFYIFDFEFDKQIDIEIPDQFQKSDNDVFFTELVFSLEIDSQMEWVALKMSAKCQGLSQYFLVAKAGPGRGGRRPRDGFLLLQQLGNDDQRYFIDGAVDPGPMQNYRTSFCKW